MKKTITVRWVCTAILIILAVTGISMGKFAGPLLLIIAAALAIPLKATQRLKAKLKLSSVISIILSVLLFYSGLFLTVRPDSPKIQDETEKPSHSNYYDSFQTTKPDPQGSYNEGSGTTLSQGPSETSTAPSSSHESLPSINSSTQNSYIPNGNSIAGASQGNTAGSSAVPEYSGSPYAVINNNTPVFSSSELTTVGYESYSALDSLGRVGVAVASLGKETMPKEGEERGSISNIYPTGWKQEKYDSISGKYLYNRSHLIGWQLSAENANRQNLITGTKYFNTKGMLPFENMVADYIKETNNHVAYRVTPVFKGSNLLASGVQIEAYSVEDNGDGISFNVFCYNVQPGITIDYSDGSSSLSASAEATTKKQQSTTAANKQNTTKPSTTKPSATKPSATAKPPQTTAPKTTAPKNENSQTVYITKTGKKYHSRKDCPGLSNANEIYDSTLQTAQKNGYTPCKKCH